MKPIAVVLVLALQTQSAPMLTADAIAAAVTSVSAAIADEYFDIALTPTISATLNDGLAAGRFSSAKTPEDLATGLNQILYSLTRDKHLRVQVAKPKLQASTTGGPSPSRDQPTTAGFRRTEILPGNIGLLELTMFLRPIEHRDALAAAMKQLEGADALIIDMRANGGGSPGTVALLMSYLFDEPDLPLFDIVPRKGNVEPYRTEPATVAMPRNGKR